MATPRSSLLAIALTALCALSPACTSATLVAQGERRELRPPLASRSKEVEARPKLFVLGLDGVDRRLLYEMLRKGELPALAAVLGGREGERFPHAHFDDTLLSTLPSCTLPAWASIFTGKSPSEHGVTGNEFFVRESLTFAAPAPVTFHDTSPVLKTYSEDYANRLLAVPTVYERLRKSETDISIWVAMSQFYSGADCLLMPSRGVMADAFKAFLDDSIKAKGSRDFYEALDRSVVATILWQLDKDSAPDVLTVYLPGTDNFAHVAPDGPDAARRAYLREVVDPLLGDLWRKLAEKNAIENRYVLLVSDHGHTQIEFDFEHALSTRDEDSPPAVLRAAGFRVRPFQLDVKGEDFQAVLAYEGAMAFVYLCDRSKMEAPGWSRPPRFQEDVLAAADAFFQASETGRGAPSMKGTIDMVLARAPRPTGEPGEPFQVYVGNGRLVPVADYLKDHPHPTYVAVDDRLRELACGRFGERAGDVLLITHNGDRERPSQRYYFAERYRSWHGSPSRQDSEVPFIVAHPRRSADDIARVVRDTLGPDPRVQKVTDLILRLRSEK